MMRSIFLSFGIGSALGSAAQTVPHEHRSCGSHSITERYIDHQGLNTDLLRLLPPTNTTSRGGTYTIPVVVHVVWNTPAENVTTASINTLIAQLNADYSAANSDLRQVRQQFTGVVGNVGFQFCLAQVTPDGSPTTGIVRMQTSDTWFDPDTETDDMKLAGTGSPAWDPTRYLNIWICDITSGAVGNTVTVGYAYLPIDGIIGSEVDGLVVDHVYGTQPGSRTATHEIGHYFGLLHPFDEEGACLNGDGFADTPTSNSPTFSCANPNLMKCGVLTQYENFMDYSSCSAMFTAQQATYMAGMLTGPRSSLLLSNACSAASGHCIPSATQGTVEGDFVNSVILNTIVNEDSGGPNEPTYTDFSAAFNTTLVRNGSYAIIIEGGTFNDDSYGAWIDFDQNGEFDESEKIGGFTSTEAEEMQVIPFTVPINAPLGSTIMRVRGAYIAPGDPSPVAPCHDYTFGETEDYGITIAPAPTSYCTPHTALGTVDGDFINSVTLASIANLNTGGVSASRYTDHFNTHGTTLLRGNEYSLEIESGEYAPDTYAAWIDLDQNSTFDHDESLGQFITTEPGETGRLVFTIPDDAPVGVTRLRVRGGFLLSNEPTPFDPCHAYAYGETEDYRVTIQFGTRIGDHPEAVLGLWPNPASGIVTATLPFDGPFRSEMMDMQGRVVLQRSLMGRTASFDVSVLAPGYYLIRVLQEGMLMNTRLEVVGH